MWMFWYEHWLAVLLVVGVGQGVDALEPEPGDRLRGEVAGAVHSHQWVALRATQFPAK